VSRDLCECEAHGSRPETYVCNHIASALGREETAGFVCYPGDDEDGLTDAWCDDCEAYLQANGGDWIDDEVEVPGGLSILCSDCYLQARKMAADAGRLRVLI
jgi:hypothetical protein